jgi:hypothetical protein
MNPALIPAESHRQATATTEPSKDGKTCRKRQVSNEKGRACGRLSPFLIKT